MKLRSSNSSILEKLTMALLLTIAVAIGAVLGSLPLSPVAAATETLLFKAGTNAVNDDFCFGSAGWHGPDPQDLHAADIWPDSSGPCGNQGSTEVWMDTYGRSTAYSTYYLLSHACDPGMWAGFQCSSVMLDVFWHNGINWAWQGSEWYIHTESTLSGNDSNNWPQIWIGYQTWSPSWFELGVTNDPATDPACDGDEYHLHQEYYPDYEAVLDKNDSLTANTDYYRHSTANYIHIWSAWNE